MGGLLIEGSSGLLPSEAAEKLGELRPEKPKLLGCPGLSRVDHCLLPAAIQNASPLLMGGKQVVQNRDDTRVFLEQTTRGSLQKTLTSARTELCLHHSLLGNLACVTGPAGARSAC